LLHPELAASMGGDRFQREVKLHPRFVKLVGRTAE
jgi:hypothetical protein